MLQSETITMSTLVEQARIIGTVFPTKDWVVQTLHLPPLDRMLIFKHLGPLQLSRQQWLDLTKLVEEIDRGHDFQP